MHVQTVLLTAAQRQQQQLVVTNAVAKTVELAARTKEEEGTVPPSLPLYPSCPAQL